MQIAQGERTDFIEESGSHFEEKGLERFKRAQENLYEAALDEIRSGAKRGHWIWYIWPQLAGIGLSWTARYYAIRDLDEAREYYADPLLHARLIEITQALLDLDVADLFEVLGGLDSLKVRSSLTLFELVADDKDKELFDAVLKKYYSGKRDDVTLDILGLDNSIRDRMM